jgi:hypothetical protein
MVMTETMEARQKPGQQEGWRWQNGRVCRVEANEEAISQLRLCPTDLVVVRRSGLPLALYDDDEAKVDPDKQKSLTGPAPAPAPATPLGPCGPRKRRHHALKPPSFPLSEPAQAAAAT